MPSQHRPLSMSQLGMLSALLLLIGGGLHSTFAQRIEGLDRLASGVSRVGRSPNPPPKFNHPPENSVSRARQPSVKNAEPPESVKPSENQPPLEVAIAAANEARDRSDYEQALAGYRKAAELNPKDERAYYGLGNVFADLHCTDSAIEVYVKALRLKPDYREALLSLGYAYSAKERYDDAETQFKAVQKTAPHDAEAWIGIGSLYTKRGKYQEAITQFQVIANDESIEAKHRAAAHIGLGGVYDRQLKYPEAIKHYEEAIKLKADLSSAYLFLGSAQMSAAFFKLPAFDNVKELSEQNLEALRTGAKQAANNIEKAKEDKDHPFNHPVVYAFLAQALAYQARYQEAAAKMDEYFSEVNKLENQMSTQPIKCGSGFNFLKADGDWESGYVSYIEALFENDDQRKTELFNKAIKSFTHAGEMKQDYVPGYSMLAAIYFKQGKYQESLDQYSKALRYEIDVSNRSRFYRNIGIAYSRLGQMDEGLKNVQEAIRLNPNEPLAYETLASIYVTQNNLEDTFTSLKKATDLRKELAIQSADSDPYYYLGATYAIRFMKTKSENDFNEAVKLLKTAIEIKPRSAMYYQALGLTYEFHSDADLALDNYLKAAEHAPKDPYNYFHMADVYAKLKHNDDAAIELLKKAMELKPDNGEAHWRLAQVYSHKGNNAEAISYLLRTIELDSKYLQAYLDLATIYDEQKNYAEAIKYLQSATQIAPTNFVPYKELGRVYGHQQKNAEAIHYYEEAINRLKAEDSSFKNLYLCRIVRLRGHYAEAIDCFQKMSNPNDPGQTIYELGLTYVASKNKKAALDQYDKLVQLKSQLAEELLKQIKDMK
jgi:tetratricopeptide (TPR) repeat protein